MVQMKHPNTFNQATFPTIVASPGKGAKDIPHQARVMTDALTRQQWYVVIWAGRQIHLSPPTLTLLICVMHADRAQSPFLAAQIELILAF